MKIRFIIPALLLISNLTTAQWTWQNPLPQGNNLICCKIYCCTIGFALAMMEQHLRQLTVEQIGFHNQVEQ